MHHHLHESFWDWITVEVMLRWINLKFSFVSFIWVILGIISPAKDMFILVMTFVTFNILTGLMAEYKEAGSFRSFWCERVDGHKLKFTVFKLLAYGMFIISSFIIERYIFKHTGLLNMAVGLMAMVEFTSMVKNIDRTLDTTFLDYLTDAITVIKEKIGKKKI